MNIVPTRAHAILDYVVGLLLIFAPWLFGFARGGPETWIPVAVGAMVLIYSLFTNYEYSIAKAISMKTHLFLDVVGGLFLAASPWLFGFAEYVFWPHLVVGLFDVGTAMMTRTTPEPRHTVSSAHSH